MTKKEKDAIRSEAYSDASHVLKFLKTEITEYDGANCTISELAALVNAYDELLSSVMDNGQDCWLVASPEDSHAKKGDRGDWAAEDDDYPSFNPAMTHTNPDRPESDPED